MKSLISSVDMRRILTTDNLTYKKLTAKTAA